MKAKLKRAREREARKVAAEEEIEILITRVIEEAPARGTQPPCNQKIAFRALPISDATLRGLEGAKPPFTIMTDIQNACIPHALAGRDILGASRTGSGKSLAFLVPALECLYRNRFTPMDGPGVIVLSPTRELAVQIFQVLRIAGKHHTFSVGLLIGGQKDFYQEQRQVGRTNVIIATPGRLLQHLEQTPDLNTNEMRMLILDEADRILDMGFRQQLVRILEYLPTEQRQTLLFSATQTRDVNNLATLSLTKPEYLGVHDKEKTAMPELLLQSYVAVPLEHKLDAVYSFVKSHLRCKCIIFFATCAQVRYAWELFCALRPGISVMALHGKLVQARRTEIYFDFVQRPHAVLFATDIAARGLDFKEVDWVVQVDAPEDRQTYIHRSGRTARYRAGGNALLLLTPKEESRGFVAEIEGKGKKIELKKLSLNPTKTVVVSERSAAMVASNADLNRLAKKAFESYIRSIYLMPNKEIFDVDDLDVDGFAKSLGLSSTPNLRFLKSSAKNRQELRTTKNVNRKLQKLKEQIKAEKLQKKLAKMTRAGMAPPPPEKQQPDSDEEEILVPKNHGVASPDIHDDEALPDSGVDKATQPKRKKIRIDGSSIMNKHVKFGDDGEEEEQPTFATLENATQVEGNLEDATSSYVDSIRERLKQNFVQDAADEKERIKEKHRKRRLQDRGERDNSEINDEPVVMLDDPESHSESSSDSSDSDDSSSEDEGDIKEQEAMALAMIRGAAK